MERIGKTLAQVRGHGEDARTLQLNSTTSGRTGETGQTIPAPPGEGDTATEVSGSTTIPSIGPTSMITETTEATGPGWQLKGDNAAEERIRKLVMDAQAKKEENEDTESAVANRQVPKQLHDSRRGMDKLPDSPKGQEGETLAI